MTKKEKNDTDAELRRQAEKYAKRHTDVSLAYIDGYNAGVKAARSYVVDADQPFVEPRFADAFRQWLEYKALKGQTYKNECSLKAAYKRLVRLSGGVEEIAAALVENCISRQWDGLFPLDDREVTAIMQAKAEQKVKEAEKAIKEIETAAQTSPHKSTTPQEVVRRLEERVRLGDKEAAVQLAQAKKYLRNGVVFATDL